MMMGVGAIPAELVEASMVDFANAIMPVYISCAILTIMKSSVINRLGFRPNGWSSRALKVEEKVSIMLLASGSTGQSSDVSSIPLLISRRGCDSSELSSYESNVKPVCYVDGM